MIRLAISQAAFEAITSTLPVGFVAFDPEPNEKGEWLIWLEAAVVDKLAAMRGPGESYRAGWTAHSLSEVPWPGARRRRSAACRAAGQVHDSGLGVAVERVVSVLCRALGFIARPFASISTSRRMTSL